MFLLQNNFTKAYKYKYNGVANFGKRSTERVSSVTGTKSNIGLFFNGVYLHDFFPSYVRDMSNDKVIEAGEALETTYDSFELDYIVPEPETEGAILTPIHTHYSSSDADMYFFHPDHLGSSSYVTNSKGIITQHMEYLPFGELLVDEHLNSHNSPFKFNAKELDAETGNYYYGARYYDPKWSIWLSVDPLWEEFPGWSPYNYTFQNPINFIDPDGRSGEPIIDQNNKTITVYQHLIFYGDEANSELSGKIATGIASQWNGANGEVTIGGDVYKVNFRVSYETVTEAEAINMAACNTDIRNNFIRVEDGVGSSKYQLGGNAGWFNTKDDLGGSTTPAHEIGHGLNYRTPTGDAHSVTGQDRNTPPGIMTPRRTQVHPRWSKEGPSNEIDPNFRRVSKDEVQAIFNGVQFDQNGRGEIGRMTNKIFTKDGN